MSDIKLFRVNAGPSVKVIERHGYWNVPVVNDLGCVKTCETKFLHANAIFGVFTQPRPIADIGGTYRFR